MINNYLNKFKFDKLKQIEQTNYKYIYIFRYNDLNSNEIILLKKKLKKLNLNFLILKQNLVKNFFNNLKGQGSLFIIYTNESNINKILLLNFEKIKLIYLINNNNIYSNIKLNNIYSKNINYLNYQLKKTIFNLLFILKKI